MNKLPRNFETYAASKGVPRNGIWAVGLHPPDFRDIVGGDRLNRARNPGLSVHCTRLKAIHGTIALKSVDQMAVVHEKENPAVHEKQWRAIRRRPKQHK